MMEKTRGRIRGVLCAIMLAAVQADVAHAGETGGIPPELVADPAKAKALLGWEARHKEPQEHIESAWKWMTGPRKGRYAATS